MKTPFNSTTGAIPNALYIRAVQLRVKTAESPLGAFVRFENGLNVIRASNSSGKTQILQAIVYALGAEAMFGPGQQRPLGSALTDEAIIESAAGDGGPPSRVVSSWCAVEIENGEGEVLVVQRFVRHPTIQPNLVRVWRTPVLTTQAGHVDPAESMFVRERGAAQNEAGFHHQLARFIGWELPQIPRYTGGEVPLYVELLFPYLYVDQRAWGSAAPRAVTHYQLREPTRRSAEFLLGLQGPEAAARRASLESEIQSLRARWEALSSALKASAEVVGARVLGIPDLPAGATARGTGNVVASPLDGLLVEVLEETEWRDIDEVLALIEPENQEPPLAQDRVTGPDDEAMATRLADAERKLRTRTTTALMVEQNLSLLEAQVSALDSRLQALSEERSRYADLRTLMRLGADQAEHNHALTDPDCPTCHQSLSALESEHLGPTLDADDSIKLLNAEIGTAQAMRTQASQALQAAQSSHAALEREIDSARLEVRSLRADLTAPDDYPSVADVTQRVTAELRRSELARVISSVTERAQVMTPIAVEIADARNALHALPSDVPQADRDRIESLRGTMTEQLQEFGFGSYSASQIGISEETLGPVRPGFDLDADVSASDVVRIKIAYLNSLRETAMAAGAPHPGLLILDEPRQHEMDESNFRSTLTRLASRQRGQSIVTSAASTELLESLLGEASASVTAFPGKVLEGDAPHHPLDVD